MHVQPPHTQKSQSTRVAEFHNSLASPLPRHIPAILARAGNATSARRYKRPPAAMPQKPVLKAGKKIQKQQAANRHGKTSTTRKGVHWALVGELLADTGVLCLTSMQIRAPRVQGRWRSHLRKARSLRRTWRTRLVTCQGWQKEHASMHAQCCDDACTLRRS